MPAPTVPWTDIALPTLEPGQPVTEELLVGIRNNILYLEQWLGAAHRAAALQNHNHDGSNSALIRPKRSWPLDLGDASLGDRLVSTDTGIAAGAYYYRNLEVPASVSLTQTTPGQLLICCTEQLTLRGYVYADNMGAPGGPFARSPSSPSAGVGDLHSRMCCGGSGAASGLPDAGEGGASMHTPGATQLTRHGLTPSSEVQLLHLTLLTASTYGGAGGGNSSFSADFTRLPGGAGGGLVILLADTALITGHILARGESVPLAAATHAGGGGGGVIITAARRYLVDVGTRNVSGGIGGSITLPSVGGPGWTASLQL